MTQPWLSTERLTLAGLLVFTLVVRGGVLWAMRGNLQQDPDAYREIAENLLQHGEFALGKPVAEGVFYPPTPTAYRPPLYPIVLSNLPTADRDYVSLPKVAVLHLLLGVATVWLTWLTARRLLTGIRGPEARQEIAPTVRSGLGDQKTASERSGGPTHGDSGKRDGPPGLSKNELGDSLTPALRPGLLPFGPAGLSVAPILAGLIVACDPILLNQQTLVMTETLAAFLAILSLWCLARFDAVRSWFNAGLAGGAIGLAVLCRPTFLPWLGLVALATFVLRGPATKKRGPSESSWIDHLGWRIINVASLAIGAAIIVCPWVIRNYRVFGKPIVTTTHGGYTLLLGNNYFFYDWLENDHTGLPWLSRDLDNFLEGTFTGTGPFDPTRNRSLTETGRQEFCYEQAATAIEIQPLSFAKACAYRIAQLWSPLPHKLTADESTGRRLLRDATCAWYCGVYILAAIGIWRLRWKLLQTPWIWGVLLCFAFTVVHTFYWTNLRMRAPLMPFVAIVAGAAAIKSKFQCPMSKVEEAKPT